MKVSNNLQSIKCIKVNEAFVFFPVYDNVLSFFFFPSGMSTEN